MLRVGVVGCGNISPAYLENAKRMSAIDIVACTDLIADRSGIRAADFGVRQMFGEEIYESTDVDIILNITTPDAHASVALHALESGKHVYNEKPLAVTRDDGVKIMALATEKGLRVGCAPDTFLGAGYQTVRKLLDGGAIGRPVSAVAFMLSPGVEKWHPNPFFYYDIGGGPMFDMGPYYLTAMVHLLGPVRSVSGTTSKALESRPITSEPFAGQSAPVNVPTHVQSLLEFESGVVATLITSFDVQSHTLPHLQIFGTEGTLDCPDPNTFGGPIKVWKGDWQEMPLEFPNEGNSRSIGLADMADAIEKGRPHRASGGLAFHVLDIMHAAHESAATGHRIDLNPGEVRPAGFPEGLSDGQVLEFL